MHFFFRWILHALVVSVLSLLLYAAVQQEYRQSANDPQVAMAEDASAAIEGGANASSVIPAQKVDIGTSVSPWLAIYDASGKPIASSGALNGALPALPPDVFDTSGWNGLIIGHHINLQPPGEDRFTWQPRAGVRQAVVIVHAGNGEYVAAGRSLREVENRTQTLFDMVAVCWTFLMIATLAWECLFVRHFRRP